MIAILISILITIASVLFAFFLFVGNVFSLIETDIMFAAKNNAFLHSLSVGQVYYRSMVLKDDRDLLAQGRYGLGALREDKNLNYTNLSSRIEFSQEDPGDQGTIEVELDVKK